MFVPIPPSAEAALAGATVLANLSGSPITIGRAEDRCLLAISERFPKEPRRSVADVDLELLGSERLRMGTFDDNRAHHGLDADMFRRIEFELDPPAGDIGLRR